MRRRTPRRRRLLSTFANQVAAAIARLYERQREMISGLQQLHHNRVNRVLGAVRRG
jgi:GAF domain-containing protein